MPTLPAFHWKISIHALREEGDDARRKKADLEHIFLSTPSARRATQAAPAAKPTSRISIHALREEGDWNASKTLAAKAAFLSTPSARRATMEVAQNGKQE